MHEQAPVWLVIPFILLLALIALGPLFLQHFWHRFYKHVAVGLAAIVVGFYVFVLHNVHSPIHTLVEYVSFISLLAALYTVSGGILIEVDKEGKPLTNVAMLLIGAIVSNLIGTTGASMLLVRPFLRMNRNRLSAYHIIFFIFIVSNVGGSLTPIGDPPLFLGFLKGVPFFWTTTHAFIPWVFALACLLTIFWYIDRKNLRDYDGPYIQEKYSGKIFIKGSKNFIWLAIVVGSVFLDPNIMDWVPYISFEGGKVSYLREIIMLGAAFLSYKFAHKESLQKNDFNFEPIREVAFIFIGIFATMMPALELVKHAAASEEGRAVLTTNTLYWITGLLSSVLDNAPTYLNFLAASMAKFNLDINIKQELLVYLKNGAADLRAISVAAVFFGAMTYIGNGPNFMVKSIAEQAGLQMPSFVRYIVRFSLPILFPVLFLVWLLFF